MHFEIDLIKLDDIAGWFEGCLVSGLHAVDKFEHLLVGQQNRRLLQIVVLHENTITCPLCVIISFFNRSSSSLNLDR